MAVEWTGQWWPAGGAALVVLRGASRLRAVLVARVIRRQTLIALAGALTTLGGGIALRGGALRCFLDGRPWWAGLLPVGALPH